jgi:hypothetical protein
MMSGGLCYCCWIHHHHHHLDYCCDFDVYYHDEDDDDDVDDLYPYPENSIYHASRILVYGPHFHWVARSPLPPWKSSKNAATWLLRLEMKKWAAIQWKNDPCCYWSFFAIYHDEKKNIEAVLAFPLPLLDAAAAVHLRLLLLLVRWIDPDSGLGGGEKKKTTWKKAWQQQLLLSRSCCFAISLFE